MGAAARPAFQPVVPAGFNPPDDPAPLSRRPSGHRLVPRPNPADFAQKRSSPGCRNHQLDRRAPSSGPQVESRSDSVARLSTATATSAGGIVYRFRDSVPELVVGRRRRERDSYTWTLPKGTPNPGETLEETALREVCEETGLTVKILSPLDAIRYTFVQRGTRIHKTVHYFMMLPTGGAFQSHDHEFEEVRWISFDDAANMLSFETERSLVALAATRVDEAAV